MCRRGARPKPSLPQLSQSILREAAIRGHLRRGVGRERGEPCVARRGGRGWMAPKMSSDAIRGGLGRNAEDRTGSRVTRGQKSGRRGVGHARLPDGTRSCKSSGV